MSTSSDSINISKQFFTSRQQSCGLYLPSRLVESQHFFLTYPAAALRGLFMSSPVNRAWFQDRLRTIKLSQRQLAKRIGLDPSSVSYMLSGKRRMTMSEAKAMADHLMVPVTEVMRQAGIEVLDDVHKVPVAGYISTGMQVTLLPNGTYDSVLAPADTSSGSFALQVRLVNSPQDGWLYFVAGQQEPAHNCLDKLCLVAKSDGKTLLATVKRGYKKDSFNLVLPSPDPVVIENCDIAWCARVSWIQPT